MISGQIVQDISILGTIEASNIFPVSIIGNIANTTTIIGEVTIPTDITLYDDIEALLVII